MAGRVKSVKWALGDDLPEELEPFEQYEGPLPPASTYRCKVVLGITVNSSGDDMLKVRLHLADGRPDKKQYTGAVVWDNLNIITDPGRGKGYTFSRRKLRQFIEACGGEWADFLKGMKAATEYDNSTRADVLSIGSVKFTEDVFVRAQLRNGVNNMDQPVLEVSHYMPEIEEDAPEEGDGSGEYEASGMDEFAPGGDADQAMAEPEGDQAEPEPYTEEELAGIEEDELVRIATEEFELEVDSLPAEGDVDGLVLVILREQRGGELDGMEDSDLKAEAKAAGVTVKRGALDDVKRAALVDAILGVEYPDEEGAPEHQAEPEPEPEPPARGRGRGRARRTGQDSPPSAPF